MLTVTASAAAAHKPPAFTDLVGFPDAAKVHFGRVARRYPAPAFVGARQRRAAVVSRPVAKSQGFVAAAAELAAQALSRTAVALQRRAQQWSAARQRRLTERALSALDAGTLRDIGFTRSEISSVAAEAAGEIEASRHLIWRANSQHIG